MKKILELLDNKKTIAGAVGVVGTVLGENAGVIEHEDSQIALIVSAIITIIGALHKIYKQKQVKK